MKTTAGMLAIELRKLADALDAQPDAKITKPTVYFYCDAKDEFLAVARLLPRPLAKRVTDADDHKWARVRIEYQSPALDVDASIPQSLTCELLEPAKPAVYRCAPILSEEEDAGMVA